MLRLVQLTPSLVLLPIKPSLFFLDSFFTGTSLHYNHHSFFFVSLIAQRAPIDRHLTLACCDLAFSFFTFLPPTRSRFVHFQFAFTSRTSFPRDRDLSLVRSFVCYFFPLTPQPSTRRKISKQIHGVLCCSPGVDVVVVVAHSRVVTIRALRVVTRAHTWITFIWLASFFSFFCYCSSDANANALPFCDRANWNN